MKIAINGFGRIGRCILRALYESGKNKEIQVAGINELADIASIAHLTRFDSIHGTFPLPVSSEADHLVVNGDRIHVSNQRDVSRLPWNRLEVDLVLEAGKTGGGSDASLAANMNIPTLDGLGPDGDGIHAVDEHILISSFLERTALLTELLVQL